MYGKSKVNASHFRFNSNLWLNAYADEIEVLGVVKA